MSSSLEKKSKQKNRFFLLASAGLILINYALFCFHIEKNFFDFFPSFPKWEKKETIKVYLPDLDGQTILEEERKIKPTSNQEEYAKFLFNKVVQGSDIDNTKMAVPLKLFVKKVWFYKKFCLFDLEPLTLNSKTKLIKNSGVNFLKAITQTIKENISNIEKVICLENGVLSEKLWDL